MSRSTVDGDVGLIYQKDLDFCESSVSRQEGEAGPRPEMMSIKSDLEQAITNEQLSLVFQPKVRLADGRLDGFEVLTRWKHPERGQVSPEIFVQIAEETELIHPFTIWVMRMSFCQLQKWRQDGFRTSLSINVSVKNFSAPNFVGEIRKAIDEFKVDPTQIEFEITESALIQDSPTVLNRLLLLRGLGVRLSIDDFGAGYASLAYLRMLPVDVLKIDRSFITALNSSKADQKIVAWTIQLAHDLGMRVVAEGVETAEVADLLRETGCDIAQGYFFGRPMCADEVYPWAVNGLGQVRNEGASHFLSRLGSLLRRNY